MILRPYQEAATRAAKLWLKSSTDPCLIDAAPAAGKSFMVADLARWLRKVSGGRRVLCLQPNAKLVVQNLEKFLMTGESASVFSASAGTKSTKNGVVFATPGTVKNSISRFCRSGQDGYCGVIIDEAHELTPTILSIIDAMRAANPNLRVIGLTGTPHRMGTGYIFRMWPDGRSNTDQQTRDPYFMKCVYRVSAREMLDQEFITPMEVCGINAAAYDADGIRLLPNGTANHSDVERAFVGHGRKTSAIVGDVIRQSNERGVKGGIMYFAATVQHAHEILASLPPENSALSAGDEGILRDRPATDKEIVKAYRDGKIKHLVSVGKYTTGFDVSHTEVIALLRFTESASLLIQILGRAWRLHHEKPVSFLLDYAGNVNRHFPDGDIYNPEIRAKSAKSGGAPIKAHCPSCNAENEFGIRPEVAEAGYQIDQNGYCLDLEGERVETDFGPMPAHFGRRCFGMIQTKNAGKYDRCNYRWTSKPCPACDEPNDIAARYCISCKSEIVDPNEKLASDFKAHKKDPTRLQTDEVVSMVCREGVSQRGNKTLRADFVTPYRSFSVWFQPEATSTKGWYQWDLFVRNCGATGETVPQSITYRKDAASGFYQIEAYNRQIDMLPEKVLNAAE